MVVSDWQCLACSSPSRARLSGVSAAVIDPVFASVALVAGSTTADCLRNSSDQSLLANAASLFGCLVVVIKGSAAAVHLFNLLRG